MRKLKKSYGKTTTKPAYLPPEYVQKILRNITCSECRGIFRNPFTVSECMHNFCEACIFKAVNSQKNESCIKCPKCSIQIGTSINVYDKIIENNLLNEIIKKIFPELGPLNNEKRRIFYSKFSIHGFDFPDQEMYISSHSGEKLNLYFSPLPNPEYREDLLPSFEKSSVLVDGSAKILSLKKYVFSQIQKDVELKNGYDDVVILLQGIPLPGEMLIRNVIEPNKKKGRIHFHYQKKHEKITKK